MNKLAVENVEFSSKDRIKKIALPRSTTPELAYLCGILAGDGSIYNRKEKFDHIIKCVGDPRKEQELYLNVISPIMKKLFNFSPKMQLQDGGTTFGFCVYSKALYAFFTSIIGLPSGKKYPALQIPSIFRGKSLVTSFIRGVADTDFYVKIIRGDYPVIVGVSKSRRFLLQIAHCLSELGFTWGFYMRKQLDPRFGDGFSVTYELNISGRKHLQKWMKDIGFSSPKHLARVERVTHTSSALSHQYACGAGSGA